MDRCPKVGTRLTLLLGIYLLLVGCTSGFTNWYTRPQAQAQGSPPTEAESSPAPTAVEVAIAQMGSLQTPLEYTGTTQPVREVALRAQVEGQLLDLQVNVGDPVTKNQLIGQLDDSLLIVVVNQAKAELAALQSEVARAEAEVSRSRIQVEQAKLALQQANADADRLQALVVEGAISTQQAEQSQTAAETAAQALQAAEELVATEQQAVESARSRVSAQQAVIAAAEKRQSYAALIAPMTGVVLERLSEPGNLIRPGEEMIRLGDFSQIKVSVQISELDRAQVQVGQSVQVTLDAFPDLQLSGNVTRISPVADAAVRLVPVEITLPNPQNQVGSGLLARVTFAQTTSQRILVPNSALQTDPQGAKTVFVVQQEGENAKVTARSVQVGQAADGQVEILTGLQQGEVLVVRSGQPLQEGDLVKLSILSESQPGS